MPSTALDPRYLLTPAVGGRAVGLLVLLWAAWQVVDRGLTNKSEGLVVTLFWGADFVFHEGGHIIWSLLGRFMSILGGSLNQVLVPMICTVQFLRQRQPASVSVGLYWTGQSLTEVATYVADADRRQLPLYGDVAGTGEGHDWHNLLAPAGLLAWADTLGRLVYVVGLLAIGVALVVLALDLLRVWAAPAAASDDTA